MKTLERISGTIDLIYKIAEQAIPQIETQYQIELGEIELPVDFKRQIDRAYFKLKDAEEILTDLFEDIKPF